MSVPLTSLLAPLIVASVTKGTAMIEDPALTPEQYSLMCSQIASMFRAVRPLELTCVEITESVNDTDSIFVISGMSGRPVQLVEDGLVIRRSLWTWDVDNSALLLSGHTFAADAVVEVYVLWHGDEELITPPSA